MWVRQSWRPNSHWQICACSGAARVCWHQLSKDPVRARAGAAAEGHQTTAPKCYVSTAGSACQHHETLQQVAAPLYDWKPAHLWMTSCRLRLEAARCCWLVPGHTWTDPPSPGCWELQLPPGLQPGRKLLTLGLGPLLMWRCGSAAPPRLPAAAPSSVAPEPAGRCRAQCFLRGDSVRGLG